MADAADLARTLLDLRRARATAVVTVTGAGVRTLIYFQDGEPVWAGEGAVDRTLGRMLLRAGLLDIEQYGVVIERMSEALGRGEELRFGEVAVDLGFLNRDQVVDALREQAGRKIMDCLGCEDADLDVREAADEVAAVPRQELSLEALVVQGIRLHWDDGRTGPLVMALADEKPSLRADAETLAEKLGLTAVDVALVSSIDGTRTTRALVAGSALGADAASRLFAALVVMDAVTFPSAASRRAGGGAPPPVPATTHAAPAPGAPPPPLTPRPDAPVRPPPPARPPVPPRTSPPSVRPASPPPPPTGPARVMPPAALAPAPAPAAPAPARAVPPEAVRFSQLPPDIRKARLEAEQQFQAGRSQLAAGKTFPAARILRRAAALYPEAAEYALWAEWCEYKILRPGAEQDTKRESVKRAAIAALQQDKQLVMGHYLLGLTLAQQGDRETAVRFLRRAVELDPDHRDAKRELQAITK